MNPPVPTGAIQLPNAVDTVSEAGVVPNNDALLQSATRKNLIRVVPILALAYSFNYIDRTTVGFAALTMNHDLGLSNAEFGAAAGLFFVGYCLLEVPSNLALYRFGARRWLARIMISWGLLSALTAFVTGPGSFYTLRVMTGAAEEIGRASCRERV
jgi:MFS transporter, ACS family, tartrate transporter